MSNNAIAAMAAAVSILIPATLLASEATRAPSAQGQVDALFERWDRTNSPGCSVAVMKDGAIVYKRGYGMANLDHEIPNRSNTLFHVASVSKQFTAAAVILLSLDGKLSLDDEVRRYIPDLPDFGAPITLRHLIHHTSGLRDQWSLLKMSGWRYGRDLITNDDVLDVVRAQKTLNFTPNSEYLYSNTGYTLLGLVVERVSGKTLRQFTQERIFKPLDMTNTFFRDDHAQVVHDFAAGYQSEGDAYKTSITNFDTVGATSLLTTVEDLLHWEENFYDPRVGGPAFVKQMLQPGVLNSGKQLTYATGLFVGSYRGLQTVKHTGMDAGYRAHLQRFPDQHFSVACLCNRSDAEPGPLAEKIADIYLAQEMQPRVAEPAGIDLSEAQLSVHAGMYLQRVSGDTRRMLVQDGTLQIDDTETQQMLTALGKNRFWSTDPPAELVFSGSGPSRRMTITQEGREPVIYEAVAAFEPSAAQLAAYAGTYVSEEIELPYYISVVDGALKVSLLKSQNLPLTAITRDVFSTKLGTLTFQHRAASVTGFVLNDYRVRQLRFNKTSERHVR